MHVTIRCCSRMIRSKRLGGNMRILRAEELLGSAIAATVTLLSGHSGWADTVDTTADTPPAMQAPNAQGQNTDDPAQRFA
jgi:hypothetical protein